MDCGINMKIQTSFITNSSSCCFILLNMSDEDKTIGDYLEELRASSEAMTRLVEYGDDYDVSLEETLRVFDDLSSELLLPRCGKAWFGYNGYEDNFPRIMSSAGSDTKSFILLEVYADE